MKQYKKVIIALLMAFVMAFVFTACGENNSKAVGSNESSSVSKEDTSSKVEKEKDKTDKDSSDKKTENKDDKQNTSKEDTSKKQDTQQTDNSQSNSAKSSNDQTATQSNQTSNNNQQSNSSQNTQTQTPTPQPTPTPTPTPEPEPEPEKQCYLTIECKTILNNMSNLTPGKESLVPADGYILYKTAVTFKDGENVFDVLLRETRARGIHMEHEYTPGFGSEYIEGINNLYEFDCGSGSGWMYYVNGSKPNYGVSKYTVQEGDNIEFRYTCDLGWDL